MMGLTSNCFFSFRLSFFLSRFLFFGLLELVSFDEIYFFDKSENDGFGSGSPGKPICGADDVVFGDCVPTGIESLPHSNMFN